MKLNVQIPGASYPIIIEKGAIEQLNQYMDPDKKTMLVYDTGIPQKWVDLVKKQFTHLAEFCFEQGEGSKNLQTLEQCLVAMSDAGLNRKSQVVALGGGVVGDLAGFAAACYMRGIAFYNIPTTVLSQVDSSVGGKTAVDLGPVKNIVGAFWQPKAVIIDPQVLETLDDRQIAAGLAEALKMGLLFDEDLVCEFEKENPDLVKIIARSIDLKRIVVEQDEKEAGLRKALNFGHTIGHALEGSFDEHEYLHGECVAAGMLYFIEDPALKERVLAIEEKLNLPQIKDFDPAKVKELLRHDKKGNDQGIDCVLIKQDASSGLADPELDNLDLAIRFQFENLPVEKLDTLVDCDVY